MKRTLSIGMWVLLVLAFAGVCMYMNANIDSLLDSDMSSELVLSKLLSQEKQIISPNWYYSTELRVLNTQLVFAPLFWLTDNWHTVRVVGSIILYLILMASAYYCCRQLGVKRMFPAVGILLLSPLSVPYINNILRGVYYIPHVAISFVLFGMLVKYAKVQHRKGRMALLCGLSLLSFVAGLGGIRQLFIFHAPIVLATAFLYIRERIGKLKCIRQEGTSSRLLFVSLLAAFFTGCGFLVNELILSRLYTFAHHLDGLSFAPLDIDRIVMILNGVLTYFGYHTGPFNSATVLFCNLLMVVLLVISFMAMRRYGSGKHSDAPLEHTLLTIFIIASLLFFVLLYAFTSYYYHDTYLLPPMVFVFPLIGAWLERLDWKKWTVRIAAGCSACLLLFCSALTWQSVAQDSQTVFGFQGNPDELAEVASAAMDKGYTTGYSIFWQGGNTLTELSNGELEMYVLADGPEKISDIYAWLQLKAHNTPKPDGPFFLVFHKQAKGYLPIIDYLDPADIVCDTDQYNIYGYDSLAQYEVSLLPPQS